MPAQPSSLWYVVQTKPRAEHLVTNGLASHGITTYLPLVPRHTTAGRNASTVLTATTPLFPGYVFAEVDFASPGAIRVRSYPGVRCILSQDGRPTPLPPGTVDTIQERISGLWRNAQLGMPLFAPGDRVRIVEGPLARLEAVFDRPLSGYHRCQVLLTLMGQTVPVALRYAALEPVRGQD